MLSLRLLGPLELNLDGRPIRLAVKKTWALLVVLSCGGKAPRARLAALLWPELDETTARRNLRRELARLREAGAPELLRAEGDWIRLHDAVDVDLVHFESALHKGAQAQALALWRAPLADGLSLGDAPEFDHWLEAQRSRLRGLWRGALQAEAEQAAPERALVHWQTLLADDPLQEQHHRAVMHLHASAGRREAALAQYQRCKSLLRDELGLAPMAETEALAARLGRESGTGEVIAAVPKEPLHKLDALLPDRLPFVGRDAEVQAMEAAWQAGRTMIIEGEGGVGKTRLALDFVAAHGPYALAHCRSTDLEVPYAAYGRALRALAGPLPTRATFGTLPVWACDELARLLPELAPAGPMPAPIRSDEERSRFFEACALGWQALADENFDAVVLDDWHHADAASRTVFAFVAQRRHDSPAERAGAKAGARLMVLLRPELNADAADAMRALRDGVRALHLRLPALSPAQVLELVRRMSGASDPTRFAARLQDATAGNAFFLSETLRHLVETGLLGVGTDGVWYTPFDDATQDYRELPVPASVHEAVLARVQRLGDAHSRVLEAAALAAEPFTPALLAPACAMSELDTVLAIEQAVRAQLLREHEAGGYAFAHDLVQQALDAALTTERRRLVHRRLALGAEASSAPAAVVAVHHEASGDPHRAVSYRIAAAEQAQRLHALPEAVAHWHKALADGATPAQALRAHHGLMLAARLCCEFDKMLGHGAALQQLAAGAALTPVERADALIAVADNLTFDNRAALALEMLERLPAALAEAVQGRALIARARAMHALGHLDETKATAQAALALASLQGAARSDLLEMLTLAEINAGDMPAARTHADAALALARQMGDEEGAARALFRRGLTWLIEGDLALAEAELQQAAQSFASRGSVYRQRHVLFNLAVLYAAQSRHAQALATVQRGWDLRPPLAPGELCTMYRLGFVDSQLALGDLGAAWDHTHAAITAALAQDEPQQLQAVTQCTLELLSLLGESGLARQLLAATDGESVRELRYASAEYWVAVVQFELTQGDAAAARRGLAAAPTEIADARVRARHALASAELRLLEGDAAAAQALLPSDGAEGMNDEMRTRALALAVRAQSSTGALQEATLDGVRSNLQGPSPFASATLQLHRALAQAASAGVAGALPAMAHAHAAFVAGLARSLDGRPLQQEAFVRIAG